MTVTPCHPKHFEQSSNCWGFFIPEQVGVRWILLPLDGTYTCPALDALTEAHDGLVVILLFVSSHFFLGCFDLKQHCWKTMVIKEPMAMGSKQKRTMRMSSIEATNRRGIEREQSRGLRTCWKLERSCIRCHTIRLLRICLTHVLVGPNKILKQNDGKKHHLQWVGLAINLEESWRIYLIYLNISYYDSKKG